ncbi:MAG: glycoside hydrolase family 88 protein [Rikenellaceae bacterium]|nr:glycoside hydrolase family 88 protein [Rikenellaceae bacterium]
MKIRKIVYLILISAISLNLFAEEKFYKKFADSEIERFPKAWQFDHGKRVYFGYTQGLGSLAMLKVWEATGDRKYYDYAHAYADTMVLDNGVILNYDHANKPYNVDMINAGKILFTMYETTGEEKYRKALDILYETMMKHPRNSKGGFWHKEIYPWQMWLDGLYMASPFLAQYAVTFDKPELLEDVINQFKLVRENMYNPETGLYYHAWDEKKEQLWADKETGTSHIFWGRSIGWWFMALVDVLDFIPEDHNSREFFISIINELADSLPKYQKDGLWFQVIDQGEREGNYQEASVSSMFMYSYAKAVNKGYLPEEYKEYALQAFEGLTNILMKEEENGNLTLTQCCAVAGLGGNPYRDGSYEYYINETIRENDGKATGPFIMGCIELNK